MLTTPKTAECGKFLNKKIYCCPTTIAVVFYYILKDISLDTFTFHKYVKDILCHEYSFSLSIISIF